MDVIPTDDRYIINVNTEHFTLCDEDNDPGKTANIIIVDMFQSINISHI